MWVCVLGRGGGGGCGVDSKVCVRGVKKVFAKLPTRITRFVGIIFTCLFHDNLIWCNIRPFRCDT